MKEVSFPVSTRVLADGRRVKALLLADDRSYTKEALEYLFSCAGGMFCEQEEYGEVLWAYGNCYDDDAPLVLGQNFKSCDLAVNAVVVVSETLKNSYTDTPKPRTEDILHLRLANGLCVAAIFVGKKNQIRPSNTFPITELRADASIAFSRIGINRPVHFGRIVSEHGEDHIICGIGYDETERVYAFVFDKQKHVL